MEIIKHPTTADEFMVYVWQRYVTGEYYTYRASLPPRRENGQFTKKLIMAEVPQLRKARLVPVNDYNQSKITFIKL